MQTSPEVTGEKRKRGRPRKYPESATPKPPPGPKRGRGRPRKDASEKSPYNILDSCDIRIGG